jgi:hypothetical protein
VQDPYPNLPALVARVKIALGAMQSSRHRLMLIESPRVAPQFGKILSQELGYSRVNTSYEMSRQLLEMAARSRILNVQPTLRNIVANAGQAPVLLDHLEILFDTQLKSDPLSILLDLSRNVTLVAVWPGKLMYHRLEYADAGHPEHKNFSVAELSQAGVRIISP